jgi:cell volume regulation protein A
MSLEYFLVISSILIVLSIVVTKFSDNLGIPTVLLFIAVGILAGSEGPGGIYFDDVALSKSIGIIALIVILFSGGIETNWHEVRLVIRQGMSLSTLGVLLTSAVIAVLVSSILGLSFVEGLLLGSIISSTDAAAVFAVLRSRNISLRGELKPLLEFESGSNDPMAVFLTYSVIAVLTSGDLNLLSFPVYFTFQMGLGFLIGFGVGKATVFLINKLNLSYQGIYPILIVALAFLIYGITDLVQGSGFLAVYTAGLVIGNSYIVQKKSIIRFFDGLAWLGQIAMFIILGLLVFPSHVLNVAWAGLLVSAVLIFVARPFSVFISLIGSKLKTSQKLLVSWVGLRGAVPIILATFPMMENLPNAEFIFNIVFFVVLISVLVQGWTIPFAAKLLNVDAPLMVERSPIEFEPESDSDTRLIEFIIPEKADVAGKTIVELGFPRDFLISLIYRNEHYIVPSGGTKLKAGDTILALVNRKNSFLVREIFSKRKSSDEADKRS